MDTATVLLVLFGVVVGWVIGLVIVRMIWY